MAAIAAITTRVEFGPLVACTNFHNPALLAKQAATIDEISGGRFILGPRRRLERDRVPRVRLPVRPSDRPVRGGVHDHPDAPARRAPSTSTGGSTRRATASCCRAAPRPDGPPLLIGSNGPRMLRITMPHADAWNMWFADTGNRRPASPPLRARRRRRVPRRRARSRGDRADRRRAGPAARRDRPLSGRRRRRPRSRR